MFSLLFLFYKQEIKSLFLFCASVLLFRAEQLDFKFKTNFREIINAILIIKHNFFHLILIEENMSVELYFLL